MRARVCVWCVCVGVTIDRGTCTLTLTPPHHYHTQLAPTVDTLTLTRTLTLTIPPPTLAQLVFTVDTEASLADSLVNMTLASYSPSYVQLTQTVLPYAHMLLGNMSLYSTLQLAANQSAGLRANIVNVGLPVLFIGPLLPFVPGGPTPEVSCTGRVWPAYLAWNYYYYRTFT